MQQKSNNHKKCSHRDKAIINNLTKLKVLTTTQLQTLHFKSLQTAQRRLNKLYKQKRINRIRLDFASPYYYFIDKQPTTQLNHIIAVNQAFIYIKKKHKSWEQMFCIKYEVNYTTLRPDGFIGLKNEFTNEYIFYFVEADLSNNTFDKVKKYNEFYKNYKNGGWMSLWWGKYASGFPDVVVITHRVDSVRRRVEEENVEGLVWEVWKWIK